MTSKMLPLPTARPLNLYLSHYAATGEYSDLEVRCKDTTYSVHRVVLCSQIKFFQKACQGPFKEASDRVIDLSHDDPVAVRAMLQFAYTGDYNTSSHENSGFALESVRVYAIATKYDIPDLAEMAEIEFNSIIELSWKSDDDWLFETIQAVYESTYCTDSGLRDILVATIVEHHEEIAGKGCDNPVQKALMEVGEFARDCFVAQSAATVNARLQPPPPWKSLLETGELRWCNACNRAYDGSESILSLCPRCRTDGHEVRYVEDDDDDDDIQ